MPKDKEKGEIYIGTSGWVYPHWEGIFYPKDLAAKDKLKYFSSCFKTAEINYSFYHLPGAGTYQNWYNQTPKNFIFALKASRFITHIKRLKGVNDAWKQFLDNALNLKEKLGPILFQFPPSFQASEENTKRLEIFIKKTHSLIRTNRPLLLPLQLRFAFEFRHKTWCGDKIYKLLKKYKAAWVIADSPNYPKVEVITTDFIYIRMHGSRILFSSKYTEKELKNLAKKIKKWLGQKLDVYVYFNNDFSGYAVKNAFTLSLMVEKNN